MNQYHILSHPILFLIEVGIIGYFAFLSTRQGLNHLCPNRMEADKRLFSTGQFVKLADLLGGLLACEPKSVSVDADGKYLWPQAKICFCGRGQSPVSVDATPKSVSVGADQNTYLYTRTKIWICGSIPTSVSVDLGKVLYLLTRTKIRIC